MNINISELLKKKSTKEKVELSFSESTLYNGYEYINYSSPINFEGEVSVLGDIVTLEGKATTSLICECSRCLKPFDYKVQVEIEEEFTTNVANKDEEIIFLEGDKINITDIIENSIVLILPMRHLCKEDCKGLCQYCGADLNESSCNCNDEEIDPRLAKLKDLFKEV